MIEFFDMSDTVYKAVNWVNKRSLWSIKPYKRHHWSSTGKVGNNALISKFPTITLKKVEKQKNLPNYVHFLSLRKYVKAIVQIFSIFCGSEKFLPLQWAFLLKQRQIYERHNGQFSPNPWVIQKTAS